MLKHSGALALALGLSLAATAVDLGAQAVPPDQRQSIETAIRALHVKLREAAEQLDAAALYAHVLDTDTPPIIEDGELRWTRAAALAATTSGLQGLTRISYHYTRDHITVLSPTTALWVAEGNATATLADGREFTAPFAETLVLVRPETEWQLLHAHRSAPNQ